MERVIRLEKVELQATLCKFVVFRNSKLQEECMRLDTLIVYSS